MAYTRPAGSLVLEGIITTMSPASDDGGDVANIAPMGPIVDREQSWFVFRPFQTATTFANLKRTGQAVFHVTDDVLLLARGAIGRVTPGPEVPVTAARHVKGVVLANACRYYELRVEHIDDCQPCATITTRVIHAGRFRDYFGLNRAQHAVLEAAILATRLHLTGRVSVLAAMEPLWSQVHKTGGDREQQAMTELQTYIEHWMPTGDMPAATAPATGAGGTS